MKVFLFLLFMSCCSGIVAQQVVATSGGTLGNVNGSISYTIGEGVAQTLSQDDKVLTQGFNQTTITVSILSEKKDIGFEISVYPNPAFDELKLKIENEKIDGINFIIYDANGKLILQKKLESIETVIPVSHFISGIYVVKVLSGSTELKSFKVIKQ